MNKKYYLLIGLIAVAVALVIGTSYAYFMATVTGGNDGNETVIKSGSLSLTLTDNNLLSLDGIPGSSASKKFTITNTGTNETIYNIKMVDVTNTFVDNDDLVYTLVGDNDINITNTTLPVNERYLATNISIGKGVTHTYTLTITFKETNDNQDDNKNATFTGKINIDDERLDVYHDNSGANAPELLDNMIPVKYDGTNWEYADTKEAWYDYDNKEWANAVVLNDGVEKTIGDTITEEDIALWYVWIPRYTYTIFNGNNGSVGEQAIQIKFENGTSSTGTVECTDINFVSTPTNASSETCIDATNGSIINGTSTYTHPAFTFGDTELTGFWVGKFEVSGSTGKITIKPNITSLRNTTVSSFFTAIQDIKSVYNLSGDSHMMKNMEWGAVAYLSHSKYGTCTDGTCVEVSINSNNSYYTGGGTNDAYKTNVAQSTTKNVYGIYDMSGGAWEYVMGNMVSTSGAFYSSNAGFDSTTIPDRKYFDSYTYSTSYTNHARGKLGDATKETLKTFGSETGGWYSDYAHLPGSTSSWFERGGYYGNGAGAGVFYFLRGTGAVSTDGSARGVVCAQ